MFQEEYRKAYDKINIEPAKLQELISRTEPQNTKREWKCMALVRPVAVLSLSLCLFCMMALPVLAERIPTVYRVIKQYAPALTEYILPEKFCSTSEKITLQAEAINITGNQAEVILSFKDAEGSQQNQIAGRVDLYDSYRIYNYGESSVIGSCSFLMYDEVEDKAYFKIDVISDAPFHKDKVKLAVNQLLTHCTEEERAISLENMIKSPKEKEVEYNGAGGSIQTGSLIPFFVDGKNASSRIVRVMDEAERNENLLEALTVTGVAYDEGVLRVQQCRGNFAKADRHIRLYLKDGEGNERRPDCSVGWKEEIDGEEVLFDESWFLISEEELKQYELYGMFYITDGSVQGDWEITVNLNE